ncbi:MAG TPA: 23S rRNA (adenine(2503)-C(2))-methyltransferase RlmN, partial [Verrucomicrobiota bacterium]|nr:23S rRNA (adenine(2503)-C(2))-methyltransferase RlmN [Verrucomicrobiota bacterium]
GIELQRPSDDMVRRFCDALHRKGVRVTMRTEKGTDIDAACGQLRLKSEKKSAETQMLGQAG